jgi:ATP-dependent RNA helicase SUPV3L1/SUV3
VSRPRVRLVADEQLTGALRDTVQARLDLWLKSHLEKMLGPLFVLAAAEDVTGIARGVAFQLVETLGVLDRQRVAEEVKGLEQPARASLRKYGVRFGAYHIYIPALLKPAPRALAAQLWALRHEAEQTKGFDDLLHIAGSGRTSFPANREIDAALYRAAGYRVCGERAVRVDILERLADLIRPALAWRDGAAGPKPAAAVSGGGFTVINGMTSLIGASGDDFASVLRSLGYRMERRPKPAEPAPVPTSEIATDAEVAAKVEASEAASAPDAAASSSDAAAAAEPSLSAAAAQNLDATLQVDAPAALTAQSHEAAVQPADHPVAPATEVEAPTLSDVAAEPSRDAAPQSVAEEPAMIEVWRPGRAGRPEGRRRPRFRRREAGKETGKEFATGTAQQPDAGAPVLTAIEAAASPPTGEGAPAAPERPGRHPRHRRGRGSEHRAERPQRERDRTPMRPARFERREREKTPDPNSPFAKLAALKAQLEADAKERH